MISTCPNCRQQVSVPRAVEPAALVRCPLCAAEYALGDCLALAPPELIVVAPENVAAEAADIPWRPAETAAEEAVEMQPAGEDGAVAASGRFAAPPASLRLRPRKQKSGLQVFLEVLAGGLAGCLVAYYALAFYYGPEFHRVGLPKLPLPFISWITAPPAEEEENAEPATENIHNTPADWANRLLRKAHVGWDKQSAVPPDTQKMVVGQRFACPTQLSATVGKMTDRRFSASRDFSRTQEKWLTRQFPGDL